MAPRSSMTTSTVVRVAMRIDFVTVLSNLLAVLLLLSSTSTSCFVNSFQPAPPSSSTTPRPARSSSNKMKQNRYRPSTVLEGATGGWGIGQSRDILPEEFARRGDRKAFEGYKLTDRGEFMRQVRDAKENMKNEEMDELLGVARMAGIQVKEQRLNKFEPEFLPDDDEDDLDLSV